MMPLLKTHCFEGLVSLFQTPGNLNVSEIIVPVGKQALDNDFLSASHSGLHNFSSMIKASSVQFREIIPSFPKATSQKN